MGKCRAYGIRQYSPDDGTLQCAQSLLSPMSMCQPGRGRGAMYYLFPVLRSHSIILASWNYYSSCKPGFRPGLQPGFRKVRAGLRHAFDMLSSRFRLFCRKPGREPAVEIDAAGSLVRARARQMECRKNPFRASQRTS